MPYSDLFDHVYDETSVRLSCLIPLCCPLGPTLHGQDGRKLPWSTRFSLAFITSALQRFFKRITSFAPSLDLLIPPHNPDPPPSPITRLPRRLVRFIVSNVLVLATSAYCIYRFVNMIQGEILYMRPPRLSRPAHSLQATTFPQSAARQQLNRDTPSLFWPRAPMSSAGTPSAPPSRSRRQKPTLLSN